jgi:hypothetical protein
MESVIGFSSVETRARALRAARRRDGVGTARRATTREEENLQSAVAVAREYLEDAEETRPRPARTAAPARATDVVLISATRDVVTDLSRGDRYRARWSERHSE